MKVAAENGDKAKETSPKKQEIDIEKILDTFWTRKVDQFKA